MTIFGHHHIIFLKASTCNHNNIEVYQLKWLGCSSCVLQQMDFQLTHFYQARICLCVCLVASNITTKPMEQIHNIFFPASSSIFSFNKFKLHGKSRIGVTVLDYGFSFRFMWAPYSSIIILCVVVVTRRKKKYIEI